MVDEFQDTDSRQLELIRLLSGEGERHLATVGDAQQSIYGFRGADVGVFRARGEGVPERDRIRLDVNYRSHADVLSFVDATCGGPAGVVQGASCTWTPTPGAGTPTAPATSRASTWSWWRAPTGRRPSERRGHGGRNRGPAARVR
jgi:hypothetical protein